MRCLRCSNTDDTYFYYGSKGYYCRKCIKFKRILIDEIINPKYSEVDDEAYNYTFKYPLTKLQTKASNEVKNMIKECDVMLEAVCGAGKTEIVVETISEYLKDKKKVCYAIARREVVIELSKRFKEIFKSAKIATLCEGYYETSGDLIVCTTHQLYRYYQSFDLLILDEVDAFPFKGDEVLENIALNSLKKAGRIIYSSATIDDYIKKFIDKREYKVVNLYRRPHNHDLIVPRIIYLPKIIIPLYVFNYLLHTKRQIIIFCETKSLVRVFYFLLKPFIKTTYVYSDLDSRSQNIKDFKDKKYQVIVATTVLERGITIPSIDIVLIKYHKHIFDKASMIQMIGRVGRSFKDPEGEAIILTNHYDKEVIETRKEIIKANEMPVL